MSDWDSDAAEDEMSGKRGRESYAVVGHPRKQQTLGVSAQVNTQDAELREPIINNRSRLYPKTNIEDDNLVPLPAAGEENFDGDLLQQQQPHSAQLEHVMPSWQDSVPLLIPWGNGDNSGTQAPLGDEPVAADIESMNLKMEEALLEELDRSDLERALKQHVSADGADGADAAGKPGMCAARTRSVRGGRHSASDADMVVAGALSCDSRDRLITHEGLSLWRLHVLANNVENFVEAIGVRLFTSNRALGPAGPLPLDASLGPADVAAGATMKLVMEHSDGTMLLEDPCSGVLVRAQSSMVQEKLRTKWTVEDVCQHVVLPLSMRQERTYVELLPTRERKPTDECVYVSAPHGSSFVDFVAALYAFFVYSEDRIPEDVFLWVDIFCSNQWQLAAHGSGTGGARGTGSATGSATSTGSATGAGSGNATSTSTVSGSSGNVGSSQGEAGGAAGEAVATSAPDRQGREKEAAERQRRARRQLLHVELKRVMYACRDRVMFFDQWDRPLALQRAWCVWEVYQAVSMKLQPGCKVHVLFAVGQQQSFIKMLLRSVDDVLQHMLAIDIRNASCNDKDDCEMIRVAIANLPGGFAKLNSTLLRRLRELFEAWIRPAIKSLGDQIDDTPHDASKQRTARELRLARLLNQAGRFLDTQNPDDARKYYEQALQLYEAICGRGSAQCAAVHNNMALLERKRGNFDRASVALQMALDLQRDHLLNARRLVAHHHHQQQQRHQHLEEPPPRARAAGAADPNNVHMRPGAGARLTDDSSLAGMSDGLPDSVAGSNMGAGSNAGAGLGAGGAAESPEEQLEKQLLDMSVTHNNLGKVLYLKGEQCWDDALRHYQQALALREEMQPRDAAAAQAGHALHDAWRERQKRCASVRGNMAMVHVARGEMTQALDEYRRVLELKKGALEDGFHPSFATTFNSIAFVHYRMRNDDMALRLYVRARDINRRAFGDQSVRVAYVLVRMALILRDQGRLEDAREALEEALDIQLEAAGSASLDTADTRNQLSVTFRLMRQLPRALAVCETALNTRRKLLPLADGATPTPQHLPLASSLWSRAIILLELGKPEGAEQARRDVSLALKIRSVALGPNHPRTRECVALLTNGLKSQFYTDPHALYEDPENM